MFGSLSFSGLGAFPPEVKMPDSTIDGVFIAYFAFPLHSLMAWSPLHPVWLLFLSVGTACLPPLPAQRHFNDPLVRPAPVNKIHACSNGRLTFAVLRFVLGLYPRIRRRHKLPFSPDMHRRRLTSESFRHGK